MKTAKQILLDAAEHLDRVGLYKGAYQAHYDPDASCCVLGALRYATIGEVDDDAIYTLDDTNADQANECQKAVETATALTVHHLALWNDQPDRTKSDVLYVLRLAADVLKRTP